MRDTSKLGTDVLKQQKQYISCSFSRLHLSSLGEFVLTVASDYFSASRSRSQCGLLCLLMLFCTPWLQRVGICVTVAFMSDQTSLASLNKKALLPTELLLAGCFLFSPPFCLNPNSDVYEKSQVISMRKVPCIQSWFTQVLKFIF